MGEIQRLQYQSIVYSTGACKKPGRFFIGLQFSFCNFVRTVRMVPAGGSEKNHDQLDWKTRLSGVSRVIYTR